MKRITTLLALLLLPTAVHAQFYNPGDEPASLKWSSFSSANYRMIYPRGLDSLALAFNAELELWRTPVSRSVGFTPNQQYRRPMPVLLHPNNASANGFVAWTPHRMELYTVPSAYSPEPLQWHRELAIHEGRHVAQMQFGRYKGFRALYWLTGELATGGLSAVYAGPAFFEGDAVVAETALTDMGRGRSADFLEYNMVAFDRGDWRNWYRWRYGSIKHYTPDYYKVGYLTFAGLRSFYDDALFTQHYYERLFDRKFGYPFFNFQKTVKERTGLRMRDAWKSIAQGFADEWARPGPFMETEPIMNAPRSYKEYSGSTTDESDIYAIESGLRVSRSLVRIDRDGQVTRLRPFASQTSTLMWSAPMCRIYWSETVRDPRWELVEKSQIRYYDPTDGSCGELTVDGRLFNPAPHPTDKLVAATDYPVRGGSVVVVLDAQTGRETLRRTAPDSLQIVESAWTSDGLVVSAIGPRGFGIYDMDFNAIVEPLPRKIKQLRSVDGHVEFLCDRSGVHELYALLNGEVVQLTSSRYGVSDVMHIDGRLYYSSLSTEGRLLARSPSIQGAAVDFSDCWHAPTPEKLSRQERELATVATTPGPVGEPRHYSKLTHALRLHSWAPIYFDYDNIQALSADNLLLAATPGATLLFQGNHGMSGSMGYSWHQDPYDRSRTRHSYHARLEYSGLYPVFEAKLDINDRAARLYSLTDVKEADGGMFRASTVAVSGLPLVSGSIRAYVPLQFQHGGWYRGIVPQARISFSNDAFNTGIVGREEPIQMGSQARLYLFRGYTPGACLPLQKMTGSVRAYSVLTTARAAVYPRLGIGGEVGVEARPGLEKVFTPNVYAYGYGYLPGPIEGHGIRITAMAQRQILIGEGQFREGNLSIVPSGLASSGAFISVINDRYPTQAMATVDYAFKALPLDWAGLGPVAYVRNLEFHISGEFACYGTGLPSPADNLFGAGGIVALNLGNLLWIPYDTRIGVSYSRSGGSIFPSVAPDGVGHNHVGMVFSIDF